VLHRNFPAHLHNNRQPVTTDLSCGSASTFVLTANTGSSNNAQSLVLMIECEDFTAAFTGDAEGATEAQAINNLQQCSQGDARTLCCTVRFPRSAANWISIW
jgi:beta-lactamase superfamily II metal-dependent hydrolase